MSADTSHVPSPQGNPPSGTVETVLALRGLASEGIGPAIVDALGALPGVTSIVVHPVEGFVRVVHDPSVITADALRERLSTVGRGRVGEPSRGADQ